MKSIIESVPRKSANAKIFDIQEPDNRENKIKIYIDLNYLDDVDIS